MPGLHLIYGNTGTQWQEHTHGLTSGPSGGTKQTKRGAGCAVKRRQNRGEGGDTILVFLFY